jgi:RNA polymerase sigma-70 factor (ECF subfamily)
MKSSMAQADETCWTVVRGAAAGEAAARSVFAATYLDVVRAYLGARWRGTSYAAQIDDAVQDVFLDCFREDGALGRADPENPGSFRTFLFAVVRNVALRHEEKSRRGRVLQADTAFDPGEVVDDERLSLVFDRAWARALLKRAVERQERAAAERGDDEALRRVELLRLRFGSDLPIREIARRWGTEPERVHREYARSREEFKRALFDEVAFHHPGTAGDVARECASLLALLGS